MTVDAMSLLSVTLLISLLGYYILPDFCVRTQSRSVELGKSQVRPWGLFWVKVFAGALGLLSLVYGLYLINQNILHSFLSSGDEHSCYFLAECLRKGKLYVDLPPLAEFFKVVHVGMRDGKWFSVYPPGWPLIWAMGLNLNIVDWLNPAMSALAVFFFYLAGIRLFSRWSVVCGLVLMCSSPFFMFTAASYFSHATCLLCISVFLYAFLRWREDHGAGKDPVGWAVLCGLAFGYGLMTRYLTMAAVAGPFLLYHYLPIFFAWKGWRKGGGLRGDRSGAIPFTFKRPQLRKSDWIFIGVVAFFMAVILYQNYLVTGKVFRAPNKHNQSWERLGFKKGHYTPVDGFFFLIARIFYLMDWFAPAMVASYLLFLVVGQTPFFPFQKKGSDPLRSLFRLSMVFLAFAYFLYYSWGGNQWGPRYFWEGMPFLCVAVADWVTNLWRQGSLKVRKFLLMFFVTSIGTSGILFLKHAEFTAEASFQRRALYDFSEETIKGQAIVFIHGFLGDRLVLAEEDAVRNAPFLNARILYAHDLGERNKELVAAYPGRQYCRGTFVRTIKRPQLEPLMS